MYLFLCLNILLLRNHSINVSARCIKIQDLGDTVTDQDGPSPQTSLKSFAFLGLIFFLWLHSHTIKNHLDTNFEMNYFL